MKRVFECNRVKSGNNRDNYPLFEEKGLMFLHMVDSFFTSKECFPDVVRF